MKLFSATVQHPAGDGSLSETVCTAWFIASDEGAAKAFAEEFETLVAKHNLFADPGREREMTYCAVEPC